MDDHNSLEARTSRVLSGYFRDLVSRSGVMQPAQKGPSRADSLRALAILERLASVPDQNPGGVLVMQLSGALLPILATSAGAGRKHTRGDEAATQRVLRALAAIWSRAAASGVSGGSLSFRARRAAAQTRAER